MMFNGRNVFIGKDVKLGKNVKIGDNTSIYDNVSIGDNTIIAANCIIGEPIGSYYKDDNYQNPLLTIGSDCIIRSNTIIYAGTKIGNCLQTGHFTIIREGNVIGDNCVVGTYCNILNGCKIGNNVHFHSYDSIAEGTLVGDYVYFYPFVTVTNDPTPPSNHWEHCEFGEFTVVATEAFILPGTVIGRHCFISAQARISGKVEDFSFMYGSPAKKVFDTRKAPIINKDTKRRQYPWPYNFDRGMPWAGVGFEQWLKDNNREL